MVFVQFSEETFSIDSCHPYIKPEDYPLVVDSILLHFDSFLGVSNFVLKSEELGFI